MVETLNEKNNYNAYYKKNILVRLSPNKANEMMQMLAAYITEFTLKTLSLHLNISHYECSNEHQPNSSTEVVCYQHTSLGAAFLYFYCQSRSIVKSWKGAQLKAPSRSTDAAIVYSFLRVSTTRELHVVAKKFIRILPLHYSLFAGNSQTKFYGGLTVRLRLATASF